MVEQLTTETLTVSREALGAAVIAGDLTVIEGFFAQPQVRGEVEDTNTYIIETAPSDDASTFTLRDGSLPWFRRPQDNSIDMDDVPLLSAARRGNLHVIQWFFSHERASFMGATLALLLPLVARYDGQRVWYQKHWKDDPVILETLLSSPVFTDYVDDDSKQSMLDSIASHCQSFQLINVALAHGARVNEALNRIAQFGITDCVAELEEAGTFLVGAELLKPPFVYWQYRHADSFLKHGVDWGTGAVMLLNGAAAAADEQAVYDLLSHGFVDVDARDELGRTALMRVSSVNPTTDLHPQFADPTPGVAWSLLETSDINLTDDMGCTALHYAVEDNSGIADILVSLGADVTIRDKYGLLAIDLEDMFNWREWPEFVKQFLDSGLDPFAVPSDEDDEDEDEDVEDEDEVEDVASSEQTSRSLYDRLLQVKGGPEFIKENPGYFNRD